MDRIKIKDLLEEVGESEKDDEKYEYALGVLNRLDLEGLTLQEKVNLLVKEINTMRILGYETRYPNTDREEVWIRVK